MWIIRPHQSDALADVVRRAVALGRSPVGDADPDSRSHHGPAGALAIRTDAERDADPDSRPDADRDPDPDPDSDRDPDRRTDANPDRCTDPDPNRGADADPDRRGDGISHADTEPGIRVQRHE
jgi:hypothetical protein